MPNAGSMLLRRRGGDNPPHNDPPPTSKTAQGGLITERDKRDMSQRKNGPYLDREPLAAIRALAEANASLREIIALAANRTAMRAEQAPKPQNPLRMEEGCGFIMKVRLCGADAMFARAVPPQ